MARQGIQTGSRTHTNHIKTVTTQPNPNEALSSRPSPFSIKYFGIIFALHCFRMP